MRTKQDQVENESLDALLDAAVDAIVISNSRGLIRRFNRAAQEMFGYLERDVIGQNVSILMPDPDRGRHDVYLQRYREGGVASIIGIGREVTGCHADRRTLPLHLSVGEISGRGEARFVAIIRDLREQKATQNMVRDLEKHLAHADRLVVLGELMAGIAHEVNQPLTAIAAYADAGAKLLASDAPEASAELGNICLQIAEQARRAGDVVRRLRGLTRKGDLSKSSHDIEALAHSVLLLFEHELKQSSIDLEISSEPGLPQLVVDEIQIQQVLVNLIKNSVDALQEANTNSPAIRIRAQRMGEFIEIRVRDNGPGVPPELQKRLFEPFFTTKLRGVGLGLSICKNIAIAHGGNLTYGQADDGSAEFILSLPLSYIG